MAFRNNFTFLTASAFFTLPISYKNFKAWSTKVEKSKQEEKKSVEPVQSCEGALKFINGVSCIPHDSKVAKGGEDGWSATNRLIVVADGVGGWANQGIDPGLFAKQLCKDINSLFEQDQSVSLK